jgi:CRP/FNR family transcriptional regulator, cyclic AMP receptor protein
MLPATTMMDAAAFCQHCATDRGGDALHLPGWAVADWQALFEQAQPVSLASGQVLIKRGQSERALYFVMDGALEVTAGAGQGEALGSMMRELPGSVIGEISFFDGRPRTASVWATQPTQLLRLDHDGWQRFATAHPTLGHQLLFALGRVLAFRMRRGEERRAGFAR